MDSLIFIGGLHFKSLSILSPLHAGFKTVLRFSVRLPIPSENDKV